MCSGSGFCGSRENIRGYTIVVLNRLLLLFVYSALAVLVLNTASAETEAVLQKGHSFFQWLDKNEDQFINCKIEKKADQIQLCDGVLVSYSEIKSLFSLKPDELLNTIKAKGLLVEIICSVEKNNGDFVKTDCVAESSNKIFKKVSSLHGLFVAEDNKIFIRSSATKGTLIHEYLHFLQSKNTQKIDGRNYRLSKLDLKNQINSELDRIEAEVKMAEKNKQSDVLKVKIAEFMKVNDLMLAFSKWQDLIDERSLFLLYVKYEKDFQIPKEDMDLVHKNLNFVCKRKDFKSALPECSH